MSLEIKFTGKDKEEAHQLREDLRVIKLVTTEYFFKTGEILKQVRDREYWRMGWDTFESYYSDPELSFKTSTVYHAIKLVETFPKWKKLLDVPSSKLIMIAPHVTKKNETDLVVAARNLSRGDLRHELMTYGLEPEKKNEPPLPKIYKCNSCNLIKGVRWDDLCHCGWTKEQIVYMGKLIDKVEFGGSL